MSDRRIVPWVGLVVVCLAVGVPRASTETRNAPIRSRTPVLLFEANHGQTIPSAHFIARAGTHTIFITPQGPVARLGGADRDRSIALTFAGGAGGAIAGAARHAAVVNYVLPGTPARTIAGIPTFTRVVQRGVWPGIDVEYYGDTALEYDLVVAPGADPRAARIDVQGGLPSLRPDGSIVVEFPGGRFIQHPPHTYQEIDGARVEIPSAYVLRGRRIGFAVGRYDRTRPLVIDPVIVYSTYLGGAAPGFTSGEAIAVDAGGNAYVTGSTSSATFPVLSASQPLPGGATDAFVAKYSPAGVMIYATYLGGAANDAGTAIAADAAGSVFVAGTTSSADFPVVAGAYQSANAGGQDTFLVKFDPAGTPVYATYFGGGGFDSAEALAIDGSGRAYIAGITSGGLPTSGAFDSTFGGGGTDAFVARFNPAASGALSLEYSTYLGGSDSESGFARSGIAVDAAGRAHVAGRTMSTDFPTTVGAYSTVCANCSPGSFLTEIFVARLSASGGALEYSTFFGGIGREEPGGIALDASGAVYFTGTTTNPHFPITAGTVHPVYRGGPYRSTDAGATWVVHNENLSNSAVHSWAKVPGASAALVAGTGSGIFRSLDGGLTWSDVNSAFSPNTWLGVLGLAVDPAEADVVYAAMNSGGVLKSVDAGLTWTQSGSPANGLLVNWIQAIAIGPAAGPDPQTIYAGGRGLNAGVYVSTNAGATWLPRNTGLGVDPFVGDLAVSASAPQTVYCSVDGAGVHRSANAGLTWTPVNTGLPSLSVFSLAVEPLTADIVYAAVAGAGVYKTINGGASWSPANAGLTDLRVAEITHDSFSPGTLYAATADGLFRSIDGAGSWVAVNTGLRNLHMSSVYVDPTTSVVHSASADGNRAFLTKLNPAGGGAADLVASTWLGGTQHERGWAVGVLPGGDVVVAGETGSDDLPLVDPLQGCGGALCNDTFVARLNSSLSAYVWSTYLGGSGGEIARGLAVFGDDVFVTGGTSSADFPTVAAHQPARASSTDAFVTRIASGAADTTPPMLAVTLSPDVLWPANGAMVTVTATIVASDDSGAAPAIELVSITSSQPEAGDIQGAAFGTDDRSFELRARRNRNVERQYTVTYRATDASGNTTLASAVVVVPRNGRK